MNYNRYRLLGTGKFAAWALLIGLTLGPNLAADDHQVSQTGGEMIHFNTFSIDKYEYPNKPGEMPLGNVSWTEARQLCQDQGKRLCTESEWEKACRGKGDFLFSYGPQFEAGRCNTPYLKDEKWIRSQGPAASGTYDGCGNPEGVQDMIGNLWEWTTVTYDGQQDWKVVRGGSWFNNVNFARADGRYGHYLTSEYKLDLIGFRCCR